MAVIYRLYFNRCEDFPQIWSIDQGTTETEINVADFRTEGHVSVIGGRAPDFAVVDSAREPKAWAEVEACSLQIVGGVAVFSDARIDLTAVLT
jgi:hypothetical protein